jgi:hypothetical protein
LYALSPQNAVDECYINIEALQIDGLARMWRVKWGLYGEEGYPGDSWMHQAYVN